MMQTLVVSLWLVLAGSQWVSGLDNGVALTPPMGWSTWLAHGCNVDCDKYPDDCISEKLMKRMADLMVSEGYLAAGYQYLNIDTCWLNTTHCIGMLPDRDRFPSGMKTLSDNIHSKGLKFGLYLDETCPEYKNTEITVPALVEWEIDYLKYNAGNESIEMSNKLNSTRRPILLGCSYLAYEPFKSSQSDYSQVSKYCNTWRNYGNIEKNWATVLAIIDWFGDNQERFSPYAGPGRWNDPDFLVVGNRGLTVDQAKIQMAVWSVMAAPLIMSVDLTSVDQKFKEILLNKDVIAVNQDRMGKQGLRVQQHNDYFSGEVAQETWCRELHDGSYAVAFFSRVNYNVTVTLTFDMMRIKEASYEIQDLYNTEVTDALRVLRPNETLTVHLNPSGVQFYKLIPLLW